MDSALRSDDQKVTLTWRTAAIDEYTHTFTLGELREAVNAERDANGYAKHPDITDDLYLLCESYLADHEQENGGALVSFDREIAEMTERFKRITLEDLGHVRLVRPEVVIEVAFDQIQRSHRHDSGYAMRFPRIVRLRPDKPLSEIDTLDTVCQSAEGRQPREE